MTGRAVRHRRSTSAPRRVRRLFALLAVTGGALAVTAGCSQVGPPEITIYADGETIVVEPFTYCDVHVTDCQSSEQEQHVLNTRAGMPAQISVPGEIAESPWLVNVQSVDEDGTPLPVEQAFLAPNESHAYTAQPPSEDARLLVVEVQQLGAAYAADEAGEPLLDEEGSVQPVARGLWPVQFEQEGT